MVGPYLAVGLVDVGNDSGRIRENKGGKTESTTCNEAWREEGGNWQGFWVHAAAVY